MGFTGHAAAGSRSLVDWCLPCRLVAVGLGHVPPGV